MIVCVPFCEVVRPARVPCGSPNRSEREAAPAGLVLPPLELTDAPIGAQAGVVGGAAEELRTPPNELDRRLSASATSARRCRLSTPRPATEEGTPLPPRS